MKVMASNLDTKTIIEESGSNYVAKWQDGDKIGVYEVANGEVQNKTTSSELNLDDSDPAIATSATATFTLSFGGTPSAPYDYAFVYPSSALDKSGAKYRIRLNKNQTFAATSFDPAADIMVSEHVNAPTARPDALTLNFARIGATARMIIKAPPTSETIQKITISTTEGNLSGLYELTPADGTVSALYSGDKEVVLTPASTTTFTGNIVVWFRCAAITLDNNFTVSVRTNLKTYTKTVDLDAASRTLEFAEGKLTKFNVNMTEVSGEANKTVDNGWYVLAAEKNGSYYALSSTASDSRLAKVDLPNTFDPSKAYETNNDAIVWNVVNGTGNVTIQSSDNKYLNSGSSAASTSSTSQSFTLNEAVTGQYEINSTSDGGIRYNSSSSWWAFYSSKKDASMIGDIYFVPVEIDRTPVLEIDDIELDDNYAITNEVIELATRKFVSSISVVGVYNEVGRTSNCSWASVAYSDGMLKLTVQKNTSTEERVAYVRVTGTGEGGSDTVDFTVTQPGKEVYSDQWILVKDDSELDEDDLIVFANSASGKTAGALSSSVLGVVTSTFSSDVNKKEITSLGAGTEQFTIGKDNGNWTFSFSNGDLLGTSAAKKLTQGSDTAVNTWSLSFSGNNAVVTSTTASNGTFQFNSDRFTTYTSTQSPIQIYKWYEDPTAVKVKALKSSITGVVAAGVIDATLTDAYTLQNATDSHLTVTKDNTVVTAASVSGGTVTYTVAANTGAARSTGWIKLAVAGGNTITITVSQVAAQYTLNLAGTNGSVSATVGGVAKANGSAIDCGATVTITATPTSGYAFDAWDVYQTGSSSTKVSTAADTSPTTFTMPAFNVTASASFTEVGEETPTLKYTLDGTTTGGSSGYAEESSITQNLISWKVMGNTTMNPWRIGGKSLTSVDRAIYSTTSLAYNISQIEIDHGAASSITVNSMTVIVSKNSDFSKPISTLTPSFKASDTVTINRPAGKDWSNCYYKIVYNVSVSGSSNKFIEFKEARFTGTTATSE